MRLRGLLPGTALVGAAALLLAGCSSSSSAPDGGTGHASVVATTTILGSITGDVVSCADPQATVTTLMPVGVDPHEFSASSQQVAQIVSADLVVANGLGLEAGLADALANAESDGANILSVGEQLDPVPFGQHANDSAAGDTTGSLDPHVWFDMDRMATAAQLIGTKLAEGGNADYATCGTKVADEIRAAEKDVRATLESVPADRRVLVTDHDALGYLADAYDYRIVGAVIPAGTTLAEPSSADLASLVAAIQADNVPAIFANTADSTALSDAVAKETGRPVQVVPLYIGSVGGPGSGAEDYLSMMRTDASLIANALNP
ncbi:MAG: zinc ABC transporter substrate-binding protein [Actinomycetales bacterium]|nr:zinc ABC transporter substrate-binding protein [Actinomycetales bacterium]